MLYCIYFNATHNKNFIFILRYNFVVTSQIASGNLFAALVKKTPAFLSDFNSTPINEATASNKFLELHVYYDSLSYILSKDSPSMDIVMLLSNLGGTIGLFLGISMLSVCEIVHVLIESSILVGHQLKSKQKTRDVSES